MGKIPIPAFVTNGFPTSAYVHLWNNSPSPPLPFPAPLAVSQKSDEVCYHLFQKTNRRRCCEVGLTSSGANFSRFSWNSSPLFSARPFWDDREQGVVCRWPFSYLDLRDRDKRVAGPCLLEIGKTKETAKTISRCRASQFCQPVSTT